MNGETHVKSLKIQTCKFQIFYHFWWQWTSPLCGQLRFVHFVVWPQTISTALPHNYSPVKSHGQNSYLPPCGRSNKLSNRFPWSIGGKCAWLLSLQTSVNLLLLYSLKTAFLFHLKTKPLLTPRLNVWRWAKMTAGIKLLWYASHGLILPWTW